MEPLSAIGLASAIVQFVDFSSKLLSGAREIYSSVSGARTEHDEAVLNIDRLGDLTSHLHVAYPGPTQTLTPSDRRLLGLKAGCQGVSDELKKILEAERAKTPVSKRSSLRAAWNNIRNKDKIAHLQSRLDRYRVEVLGELQAIMSDDVSEIKMALTSLIMESPKHAESMRKDLERTQTSIIRTVQAELQFVGSQNKQHINDNTQQTSLEQIHKDLFHLLETMRTIPAQDAVLDMLWFDTITTRQRSVDPAHSTTFRWLLHEEEFSEEDKVYRELRQHSLDHERFERREKREVFINWLRSGRGVFYISGKAGAGKSTLMKFLSQEEKTRQELQAWAESDGKQLILARFFFWNSGDQLQKSLEGLYRAILWDILRQFPALIPHAFPNAWSVAINQKHKNIRHHPSFHIELKDLRAALDRIFSSQTIATDYKLCIFIDGLDEFHGQGGQEGDYWTLSKSLSSWSTSDTDIKFCVSSRPYEEFLKIFASDPSRHLRLHDLTRQDMFSFVRSKFQGDGRSADIRADSEYYSNLIEEIVDRSDGIFLWVLLVTSEMLKAMGRHSSPAQLDQRLINIPKGLRGVFKRIFDAIDGSERRSAAQMLLVMKLKAGPKMSHRWLATYWVMEKMMDNQSMPRMSDDDWLSECQIASSSLLARFNGLVELAPLTRDPCDFTEPQLQFVHRSVQDFLEEDEIERELLKLAGSFSPWEALVRSILAVLNVFEMDSLGIPNIVLEMLSVEERAECHGLPPFMEEMRPLIQTCRMIAEANYDRCLLLPITRVQAAYNGTRSFPYSFRSVQLDDIESAIVSRGIWYSCINFCLQQTAQNTALMSPRPQGTNILLAAALRDIFVHDNEATDDPTKLLTYHFLNINDSFVNTPSISWWDSINGVLYFPDPTWTTWTSFLFAIGLNFGPFAKSLESSDARSRKWKATNMIHLFLEHGADVSACIILCKLDLINSDIYQRHKTDISDGIFYATLPAMMEYWGLPLAPKTRELLDTPRRLESGWSFASVLKRFRAAESPPQTIRKLGAQEVNSAEVVPVKVVTYNQLQEVRVKDVRIALDLWDVGQTHIYFQC